MMTTTNVLDTQALQFQEPIRYELSGGDKHYYLQDIKYNGNALYITSDWFLSEGPKKDDRSKAEMLIKIDPSTKNILKFIEDEAKTQVAFPNEYQVQNDKRDVYFKSLPDKDFLYIKFDQGIQCYDKKLRPMALANLQYGKYRVILFVKGIYIGGHGSNEHLASLHLKIKQIQCESLTLPCMFRKDESVTPVNNEHYVTEITPRTSAVTAQPRKKKSRRPRLERQNAMAEAVANMGTMDGILTDFGL